ncbi:Uncharacterized protein OBRU01_17463 [Operophtera brumata]|uniref:Uncharacterized protein n=1 Tax=Operophtera brumata TaxID=104452 RepID=A0A0L7L285_OPEBR|nr:Uncharacterized protein OBRU01_17463 [Operophtera brumata]
MIHNIFRRNRTKLLAATAIFCCVVILNTDLSPDLYFLSFNFENVSCYYEYGDELTFVSDRGFNPPAESIFFHETSCRGGLDSRQACAVEAAARANKHWDIHVLFLAPVKTLNTKSMQVLQELDRVKFARINLLEYAKNTPLEDLVASGALNRTKWRISHTSDVIRYLTLYKWGGVYLDLDTVVVKPLGSLSNNWSARESDQVVAAGFEVYGPELFYPIRWEDAIQYFEPGDISEAPFIYHVWNRITHDTRVLSTSLYAKLARKFCPSASPDHDYEQDWLGELATL